MPRKDIVLAVALAIVLAVIGLTMGKGGVGDCVTEDQAGTCVWQGHVRTWNPDH